MLITVCKSKITGASVTQAELYYEGSITIDEEIINAAGIIPGEKVEVLNVNNGSRLETYVITGEAGSGIVCLNGPAARQGHVGDQLIILSYCFAEQKEAERIVMQCVSLSNGNKIKS